MTSSRKNLHGTHSSSSQFLVTPFRPTSDEKLLRSIIRLAIPMVTEVLLESAFSVVDIFWVSKLGSGAISVVGLTEPLVSLILSTSMGLGIASGAVVARRVGEKATDQVGLAAAQALILSGCLSVLLGIVGWCTASVWLRLLGASSLQIVLWSSYSRLLLGGCSTIIFISVFNALFRAVGDPAVCVRTLWLANSANLLLDPILMFGIGRFKGFGIAGAAIATTSGRSIGILYQMIVVARKHSKLTIRKSHFRFDSHNMMSIFKTANAGIAQFYISDISWVAVAKFIQHSGAEALAAYVIALRIVNVTVLPGWGLGNAAATLVGQNLGAHKPERAERAVWMTGKYAALLLAFLGGADILLSATIVQWFSPSDVVTSEAAVDLAILGTGFVFYAYSILMAEAFGGAGDTITPTLVSIFCYWCIQIPLAWILSDHWGARGAIVTVPMVEGLYAAICIVLFRRGTWKSQTL
jgi:putative MATE family efflux protein